MSLGKYLSTLTKPELDEFCGKSNFSDDEYVVFRMLSKGKSITEIAINLSVCERTINRRVKAIKNKLLRIEGLNGKNNG